MQVNPNDTQITDAQAAAPVEEIQTKPVEGGEQPPATLDTMAATIEVQPTLPIEAEAKPVEQVNTLLENQDTEQILPEGMARTTEQVVNNDNEPQVDQQPEVSVPAVVDDQVMQEASQPQQQQVEAAVPAEQTVVLAELEAPVLTTNINLNENFAQESDQQMNESNKSDDDEDFDESSPQDKHQKLDQSEMSSNMGNIDLRGNGSQNVDSGQLYTITLDTYKASRLNSILSQLNIRIDPIDQVLLERRRREVTVRQRNQQQMRLMKQEAKMKEREDKKNAQKLRRNLTFNQNALTFGSQLHSNMAMNQLLSMPSDMSNPAAMQNGMMGAQNSISDPSLVVSESRLLEGSQFQNPTGFAQSATGQIQPNGTDSEMKNGLEGANGDMAMAAAGEGNPMDPPNNLSDVMKAQTENLNMGGSMLLNQTPIAVQPMEVSRNALSPTPRKSERERKNISYDKLNKGAPNSDDDSLSLGKEGFTGIPHHNSHQQKDKPLAKKQNVTDDNNSKKQSVQMTNKKIQELFDRLKQHPHAHIFNEILDPGHALYEDLKANYNTLMMLDIQLKTPYYQNTSQVAQEFRNMIHCKFRICSVSGTPDLYNQVQDFYNTFEIGFRGLDNMPLINVKEPTAPKPPNKTIDKKPAFNKQKSTVTAVTDNKSKGGAQINKKPPVGTNMIMTQINPALPSQQKPMAGQGQGEGTGGQAQNSGPVVIYSDPKYRKMTQEETSNLKNNIDNLTMLQKKGIVPIVQSCIQKNSNGDARYEFELDKLAPEVARKLEQYVNEQVAMNVKKQKRKEADKKRRENKRLEQEQQKQQQALDKVRQANVAGLIAPNIPLQTQKTMQSQGNIQPNQVNLAVAQQAAVANANSAAQMAGNQQQFQIYQQMMMAQQQALAMSQGQAMLTGNAGGGNQQMAAMQNMIQNNAAAFKQFNLQQAQNIAVQQQQQQMQQQPLQQQPQAQKKAKKSGKDADDNESSSSSSDSD